MFTLRLEFRTPHILFLSLYPLGLERGLKGHRFSFSKHKKITGDFLLITCLYLDDISTDK